MGTLRFGCAIAGFIGILAAPADGATFNVTNPADAHDLLPGNGTCSSGNSGCTLRAAIEETNALASADVINVPAGVYLLSLGPLEVSDDLRILGTYPASVDGQLSSTVFIVHAPRARIHVEFHRLDIRNGNTFAGSGGGIWNDELLLLNKCSIYYNRAGTGGGGIHNNSTGVLSIVRSSIFSNGHIVDESAEPQRGGGLQNSGIVYVDMSTFSTNAAARGGGIFQGSGSYMIVRNSTVSTNTGTIDTGGILNGGTLYLNNVTVAFNAGLTDPFHEFDEDAAGGISGGDIHMANTIVARNEYGPGPVGFGVNMDCTGTIDSAGYNLVEDTSACTLEGDLTGNILGEDPNLGILQLNGGDTKNHALPADSPAVNAGSPASPDGLSNHCEPADQRYRIRGVGPGVGRCDIGAYERNAMPGQVGVAPPRP